MSAHWASERPQNVAEYMLHNNRYSARVSLWEEFVDDACHRPTEIDEHGLTANACIFLLVDLFLWPDKPCTVADFDLPVGGSVMDCKNLLATSGKLGENVLTHWSVHFLPTCCYATVLHIIRFNNVIKLTELSVNTFSTLKDKHLQIEGSAQHKKTKKHQPLCTSLDPIRLHRVIGVGADKGTIDQ